VTPAQIKVKRTESILQELIPEALTSMNDGRLREIDVIEVTCSRGRSDAKVYVDPASYTQQEKDKILSLLSKARPIIEEHCLRDQGWYRCPKLTFEFDEQMKKSKRIEELFAQIEKNDKNDKKDEV